MSLGRVLWSTILALAFTAALFTVQAAASETLTLDEAIDLALQKSAASGERSLRLKEIPAEQAAAAFDTRWTISGRAETGSETDDRTAGATLRGSGEIRPGVTWTVQAGVSKGLSGTPISGEGSGASGSVGLSVQLWPPARDERDRTEAKRLAYEAEAARLSLERAKTDLAITVFEAYRRLQIDEARLLVRKEALQAAESFLDQVQKRHARGLASDFDLLNAEISRMQAANAYQTLKDSTVGERRSLGRLTGRGDLGALSPLDLESFRSYAGPKPPSLPEFEAAVRLAADASLEVATRRRDVVLAEEALEAARRANGWSARLSGDTGWTGAGETEWSLFVEGAYALIDADSRALREESARLGLESARAALDAALEDVADQVRQAFDRLEFARRDLEMKRASAHLRERELEAAAKQQQQGLIATEDLAERERVHRLALLDLAEAHLKYQVAHLGLLVLSGEPLSWDMWASDAASPF